MTLNEEDLEVLAGMRVLWGKKEKGVLLELISSIIEMKSGLKPVCRKKKLNEELDLCSS